VKRVVGPTRSLVDDGPKKPIRVDQRRATPHDVMTSMKIAGVSDQHFQRSARAPAIAVATPMAEIISIGTPARNGRSSPTPSSSAHSPTGCRADKHLARRTTPALPSPGVAGRKSKTNAVVASRPARFAIQRVACLTDRDQRHAAKETSAPAIPSRRPAALLPRRRHARPVRATVSSAGPVPQPIRRTVASCRCWKIATTGRRGATERHRRAE